MELSQQNKNLLIDFMSHAGWALIKRMRDELLMETMKKQMQNSNFDPTSEESHKMMEETSLFARQQKVYEDIIQKNTLFTHIPNLWQ